MGAVTAVAGIISVLIVQAAAIAVWPDIALFKPLDSYTRTALFTLIPAVGATAVFAWLTRRNTDPVSSFLKISAVVLVLSIIPDYLLPVEHKTFLAGSVTGHFGGQLVFTYGSGWREHSEKRELSHETNNLTGNLDITVNRLQYNEA
jgi:hypothetical protein